MSDAQAHEFYKDPANLEPVGPWVARRVRPGLRNLTYDPPSVAPQTVTTCVSMQPFWEKNPQAGGA